MNKDAFNKGNADNPEHLKWKSLSKDKAYKCAIFSIDEIERVSPDGKKKGKFISVNSPEWVVVLPWFRDEDGVARFVIEQQYRHGSDSITREFPAGLVEKGEAPLVAAKRELLEETGASAEKFTLLGNVSPNSAFMDNRQNFFLAENLKIISEQNLDPNEEIDVLSVPVKDVIEQMGTGLYDNGIMMMAVGFFLRLAETRKELL